MNQVQSKTSDAQSPFEGLFNAYFEIRETIQRGRDGETAPEARTLAELLRAQNEILASATTTPGQGVEDAFFKLALWRWSKFDDVKAIEDLSPSDALVFSAFRDLASQCERDALVAAA